MEKPILKSMQTDETDVGRLQINVTADVGQIPIQNATISISFTGEPDSTVETLNTDSSGQTDTVSLRTPPLEYSLTPNSPMPYSEYTVSVTAPGYEPVTVSGVEVLPDVTAVQNIGNDSFGSVSGTGRDHYHSGSYSLRRLSSQNP